MIVAISSGKGGTGKTTIATNLASMLSETMNTALVDLDVEEPNSGLFLHGRLIHHENIFKQAPQWLEKECKPCDVCHDVCRFNAIIRLSDQIMIFDELCHSCFACVELCPEAALKMTPQKIGELAHKKIDRLDFIDAILDIGREQAVPLISHTIQYANQNIENNSIIIYDTPPGTSCPVIEATKKADYVILITEPTPFGLNDLKLSVEAMKKLGREAAVVINRDGIGNNDTDIFCQEAGLPIIARIPNDRRIAEMYSDGKLIYNEHSAFRDELSKIEQSIRSKMK